jgi:hypothetical protein
VFLVAIDQPEGDAFALPSDNWFDPIESEVRARATATWGSRTRFVSGPPRMAVGRPRP